MKCSPFFWGFGFGFAFPGPTLNYKPDIRLFGYKKKRITKRERLYTNFTVTRTPCVFFFSGHLPYLGEIKSIINRTVAAYIATLVISMFV